MNKTCALYVRVSTTEQAEEGYSIQSQKERLTNYCMARDWDIFDSYTDPGYSGSNLNRPGIQKLIKEIKNFDTVLVFKLDRLSRSQKDTLYLIEDIFLKNKVDVVSISESFDTTTSFGRASIGILSVFAQLERETIKERSMIGKLERAKQGLFHGSIAPIGYDYKNGQLVIKEEEAVQIRDLFAFYLQGYGTRKVSELMEEKGYRHKYGDWESNSTVTNVLDNPLYAGKIVHRGEPFLGQHEAIISLEIFEKAQKLRKKKINYNARVFTANSLLAGFLFCAHCGGRYFKRNASNGYAKYSYYVCYSRDKSTKHMIKDHNCKNKFWIREKLDKIIEKKRLNLSPEYSKINKKKEEKEEEKRLEKKIASIEKQINKLLDLYQTEETVEITEVRKRIHSLHEEKKKLEEKLEVILQKASPQPDELKVFIDSLPKLWQEADLFEKRTILEFLIERIIIDNEDIEVMWRV